jgi:hypothetical protein
MEKCLLRPVKFFKKTEAKPQVIVNIWIVRINSGCSSKVFNRLLVPSQVFVRKPQVQVRFLKVKESEIVIYISLLRLRDYLFEPFYGLFEIPLLILFKSLRIGVIFTEKKKFFDDMIHIATHIP